MGMFDDLQIEYPLPDLTSEQVACGRWQTKDTPAQYMYMYRITPEGRLMEPIIEHYVVPEDERPLCKGKAPEDRTDLDKLCGMMGSKHLGERDLDWHGYLNFYDNIDGEWFEYLAKFTNGQIVEVERVLGFGQERDATGKIVRMDLERI